MGQSLHTEGTLGLHGPSLHAKGTWAIRQASESFPTQFKGGTIVATLISSCVNLPAAPKERSKLRREVPSSLGRSAGFDSTWAKGSPGLILHGQRGLLTDPGSPGLGLRSALGLRWREQCQSLFAA